MAGLGILMVSNVRYPSFKKINYQKSDFIRILVILLILFSILYLYPLESAAVLMSAYIFYGIARGIWAMFFAKKIKLKDKKN